MTWLLVIWFAASGDSATIGPFAEEGACVELSLAIEGAGHGAVHAGCAPAVDANKQRRGKRRGANPHN